MTATSKRPGKPKSLGKPKSAAKDSSSSMAVDAVFKAYPQPAKAKLLALRRLILATAKVTPGVGRIEEALKWGQPSYLTTETKSGSTVRIDRVSANQYAIYFHCHRSGRNVPRTLSRPMELRRQSLHPLERRGQRR
jgi:hypothetical protein